MAPRVAFTDHDLPSAPTLTIEVLSPSTRRIDLTLKHSRFEVAGCPSYWVVDPAVPSVVAWELREGAYAKGAQVTGAAPFTATAPFPVTFCPAELIA